MAEDTDGEKDETRFLGLELPTNLNEQIEEQADSRDISKSEFVREAIRSELGERTLSTRVENLENTVNSLEESTEETNQHLDELTKLVHDEIIPDAPTPGDDLLPRKSGQSWGSRRRRR